MKVRIRVGREYDGIKCDLDIEDERDELDIYEKPKRRAEVDTRKINPRLVVWLAVITSMIALGGTSIYSVIYGDGDLLRMAWTIVARLFALISHEPTGELLREIAPIEPG